MSFSKLPGPELYPRPLHKTLGKRARLLLFEKLPRCSHMLPRSRIIGFLVNTSGLRKWLLQGHTVKARDCLWLPGLSQFFHVVKTLS